MDNAVILNFRYRIDCDCLIASTIYTDKAFPLCRNKFYIKDKSLFIIKILISHFEND